jgi:isopenicillin-N epimerase
MIQPLVVSWGYHTPTQTTLGSQFLDYLSWSGTKDPAAYLSVPAAIQFMDDHRWDRVRQACHILLRQTIQRICALAQTVPAYPVDSDLYLQMGIAPLPTHIDPGTLKKRLYDEYRVEIPVVEWQGRKHLRISVQAYNTPEDLDALSHGLETLLPQVRL